MPISLHPSFAVHPGGWLCAELVEPHGLTVTEAAAKLHVTRQAMSNLLGGRAGLSAEMAVRFKKAFGVSADTLMRMQGAHDLTQVQVQAREGQIEVEQVAAQLKTLYHAFPAGEYICVRARRRKSLSVRRVG